MTTDLAGGFALTLAMGIVFNEIGERIPFWNSYVGGGLVLSFLASAYLFTNHLIPEQYAKSVSYLMNESDFLSFFIVFLICGSILGLERNCSLNLLPAIFPLSSAALSAPLV